MCGCLYACMLMYLCYMCMYLHVCMCMSVYHMYMYICNIFMYVYIYGYVWMHAYVCFYMFMYVHTPKYTYIHKYIYSCVFVYVRTNIATKKTKYIVYRYTRTVSKLIYWHKWEKTHMSLPNKDYLSVHRCEGIDRTVKCTIFVIVT